MLLNRRREICLELERISQRLDALTKECNEIDVAYAKQKVEQNGAYFISIDLFYFNKKSFHEYKCVPATLHVPIERNGSTVKLLRDKSFFVCAGEKKVYNHSASEYYEDETDDHILSDISDKETADFVYEEDFAIIKK